MASGKTLELIDFSKRYTRKLHGGRKSHLILGHVKSIGSDKEPRDRSLRGKARIKARRERHGHW